MREVPPEKLKELLGDTDYVQVINEASEAGGFDQAIEVLRRGGDKYPHLKPRFDAIIKEIERLMQSVEPEQGS